MTEEEQEAFDSVVYYQVDGNRSGMKAQLMKEERDNERG